MATMYVQFFGGGNIYNDHSNFNGTPKELLFGISTVLYESLSADTGRQLA